MKTYRIAFLTCDWNYELVESTLRGLKDYVAEHENVYLRIFDCFGKDQGTEADLSEYAIYGLPDLSQFDGVLVQGNQIVLENARSFVERMIREAGIPAVTIDCPMEGCVTIGIDNRQAQYDMAEHLIREHSVRRVVYLTGMLGNGSPEGQQRLDGFLDACRLNGLREEDVQVVPGSWRTTDGRELAERWLREKKELPDAFVCANDEMALGLLEAFAERGIFSPDSFLVTGFDNLNSAELSIPRLSTVARDNGELDYYAMDRLIALIDGSEETERILFPTKMVFSESCGCPNKAVPGYIRDRYFHQTRFLKSFHNRQEAMAEEMLAAGGLPELMDTVNAHREIFGCERIWLCVNDWYYDSFDKEQWHDSRSYGENMVLGTCGEAASWPWTDFPRFPRRELLPKEIMERERFLMFYPLHYDSYSIGYLALSGISEASQSNLHKSLFNFMEVAFENVRKKCLLRQFNAMLESLSIHDGLTGLYNRVGYERYARATFERLLENEGGVRILFADLDKLKAINDRWGHEAGDEAIRLAAEVLRESCRGDDFLMRYGGDEFLVIASCRETELEQRYRENLDRRCRRDGFPGSVSVSVGSVTARRGDPDAPTLDDLIRRADVLMYERKRGRRIATAAREVPREDE